MRHLSLFLLASALCLGCDKPPKSASPAPTGEASAESPATAAKAEAPPTEPKAEPAVLTVYSGRGAVLVEPLFETFTAASGIKVEVRYDKSTGALAERLATEGPQSPADVFFAQDSGYLGALAKRDLLRPIPAALSERADERHRPKSGKWVPVSGRARVLVYSPERVLAEALPKSLADLATPTWKGRIGWAPSNASFQAHVSALRHLWGEGKTREWLTAVKANEPTVYPKNSPQVKAVSSGEIDLGWVNHYYLHKLRANDPSLKAANHSLASGDAGNLMMLSGVGITAHTDQPELAEKLIAFLLSDEAQTYFANKVYEYPVRGTIARHPDVPALSDDLVQVEQAHLTDVSGTVSLLRDLDLN